jgi:hypothetical protein
MQRSFDSAQDEKVVPRLVGDFVFAGFAAGFAIKKTV